MIVSVRLKAAQVTPRKARLLSALVKGGSALSALAVLSAERRAGAKSMAKLIRSALAQLPQGFVESAVIVNFRVDQGKKRTVFMPRAQGRASPVEKKSSHFLVEISSQG